VFKPLSYKLCGVFDAGPGSLLCLCDEPLHHWLKGDLVVLALEACQHILCHCLREGTTLCLQVATDDLLHLQHLGSCGVNKWECDPDLLHRIPGAEASEVERHQCSLNLAWEVLDFLCLTCPGCQELLQPTVSGSQLLKLPFHQQLLPFCQPLLPIYQLFLPGAQAHVPDVGDELTG
jgi:hypothetical protein